MSEMPKKNPQENDYQQDNVVDISSSSKKKTSKKRLAVNIGITFLSVLFIVAGSAALYANSLLSKYQYVEEEPSVSKTPIGTVNTPTEEMGEAEMVDGMYHDDMVTNILLLGVDDYTPNDPGRSDSMLMVSLDRRHKKLKLTSFMRDTFVSIPGYQYYKLNTGYFLGGAPLQVKT